MLITFVSNYINHHQLPFCKAMVSMSPEVDFHFIQVMPMEQKRIDMGWGVDVSEFPFVHELYKDEERCKELILNSDVTIFGWTEGLIEDLEKERLSSGKLSFRVSERIYREGRWKAISPRGLKKKHQEHFVYRKAPVYLLCAGAYVAADFDLIKCYPGKMLKWGYFPQSGKVTAFDKEAITADRPIRICWAGRLIDLKHPEFAVKVAKTLADRGDNFQMEIIGDGRLLGHLKEDVLRQGLSEKVSFTGGLAPSEVLEHMAKADIFLFTSNYLEGWGAVVNEAMENGCCVVASEEAGAVPYLIEDGVNGRSYRNGSYREFEEKVLYLFDNNDKIREYGKEAFETSAKLWNAENAAKAFTAFCRKYLSEGVAEFAENGPMSRAQILKPAGFVRSLGERNILE
jgi:glycosyltransferase involved in cell wall biosynthesis